MLIHLVKALWRQTVLMIFPLKIYWLKTLNLKVKIEKLVPSLPMINQNKKTLLINCSMINLKPKTGLLARLPPKIWKPLIVKKF